MELEFQMEREKMAEEMFEIMIKNFSGLIKDISQPYTQGTHKIPCFIAR